MRDQLDDDQGASGVRVRRLGAQGGPHSGADRPGDALGLSSSGGAGFTGPRCLSSSSSVQLKPHDSPLHRRMYLLVSALVRYVMNAVEPHVHSNCLSSAARAFSRELMPEGYHKCALPRSQTEPSTLSAA